MTLCVVRCHRWWSFVRHCRVRFFGRWMSLSSLHLFNDTVPGSLRGEIDFLVSFTLSSSSSFYWKWCENCTIHDSHIFQIFYSHHNSTFYIHALFSQFRSHEKAHLKKVRQMFDVSVVVVMVVFVVLMFSNHACCRLLHYFFLRLCRRRSFETQVNPSKNVA